MKNIIITAVATAVILTTGYIGYSLWQERSMVEQDHVVVAQIVALINKSQASQSAASNNK